LTTVKNFRILIALVSLGELREIIIDYVSTSIDIYWSVVAYNVFCVIQPSIIIIRRIQRQFLNVVLLVGMKRMGRFNYFVISRIPSIVEALLVLDCLDLVRRIIVIGNWRVFTSIG